MRFNMGCGHNRADGFVNVDAFAECDPDQVWDLEQTPWPWPDNSATEVRFIHSLEHMGGDPKVFLAIMRELYRIAAPGCVVEIHVPHPRHDDFLNDPTHVRAISPQVLALFDRELNDQWKVRRIANSPLAHYTGTDFKTVETVTAIDGVYREGLSNNAINQDEFLGLMKHNNSATRECRIELQALKSVETEPVYHNGTRSSAP